VRKAQDITCLGSFDITELERMVRALDKGDWDKEEDFRVNYNKSKAALKSTQHIILKFSNKQVTPYQYIECSNWNDWSSMLLPLMEQIVEVFGYERPIFPRVMLAKLPQDTFIAPHIDGDTNGYVPHKIHVPIATNEFSFFFSEDRKHNFKKGFAYEVNNGIKHAVVNKGKTDRVHLIFECLDFNAQNDQIKSQILNPVRNKKH